MSTRPDDEARLLVAQEAAELTKALKEFTVELKKVLEWVDQLDHSLASEGRVVWSPEPSYKENNMSAYRKFLVAFIGVVVTVGNVIVDAMNDDVITNQEWGAVVVAALIALGVYQVKNEPSFV